MVLRHEAFEDHNNDIREHIAVCNVVRNVSLGHVTNIRAVYIQRILAASASISGIFIERTISDDLMFHFNWDLPYFDARCSIIGLCWEGRLGLLIAP